MLLFFIAESNIAWCYIEHDCGKDSVDFYLILMNKLAVLWCLLICYNMIQLCNIYLWKKCPSFWHVCLCNVLDRISILHLGTGDGYHSYF